MLHYDQKMIDMQTSIQTRRLAIYNHFDYNTSQDTDHVPTTHRPIVQTTQNRIRSPIN